MNTTHPSRLLARDPHHAVLASHASCALLRAACLIPPFVFVFFSLPASPQSPASAIVLPASQNSTATPQTLDRVVAVVNNHAILLSDIDEEIRLSILDPADQTSGILTPQRATEQLISRALIEQQMRQEDIKAADPTQAEIDARLKEIRTELPACVHANCASDDGWKAFLAAHGLTQDRVDATLRYRLQILSFIELRFRQGISVSDQEIAAYYHDKLLPQYTKGEEIPPLEKVAPRIQEILLQQKVNVLFDDWLRNLRTQGDVEVLDPSLEKTGPAEPGVSSPQTQGTQTGEGGEQ
jgi:peptidyl-prolyl cis-trans isomerase SurA